MVGTMTRLQATEGGTSVIGTPAQWIPRTVRCRNCGSLSREEVREQLAGDETRVRYECGACRQTQTRYYTGVELGAGA